MSSKKILWVSMYAPVGFASSAGSQTFNCYFKQFLADSTFDIRLISCGKYQDKAKTEEELKNITHNIIYWGDPSVSKLCKIKNLESKYNPWNPHANMISNYDVDEILATIHEYLHEGFIPDVVILEWTPIVLLAKEIRKMLPNSFIVASEHDVTYVGFERKSCYYKGIGRYVWKHNFWWEKKREVQSLKYCDLIMPHNCDNIELLEREGISAKKLMWMVPYFNNMTNCQRQSNYRDILFFGAMARPENYLSAIWFVDNVMPLLNDIDIRFVILGGNPPEVIKKLESERIHVTGFVDSILPFFEQSMCMVAPLVLGAGIKVKVVEGLSSGIPVLTNDIGVEGIHVKDKEEYFHCTTAEEYSEIIHSIVNHEIDEDVVSANAIQFIMDSFSPFKCLEKYKTIIANAIKSI